MNISEEALTLDSSACGHYLSWLLGEDPPTLPKLVPGLVWALAHCDDGVTWGRYDAKMNSWHLGNRAFPDLSPSVSQETLQELRLFGESGEALIWRTDSGLRGRVIGETESESARSKDTDPLRPSEESRLVRGNFVVARREDEFTQIGDGTGAEQVLPLIVSTEQLQKSQIRLVVRHYFERDPETGMIRLAATRLVRLMLGDNHDS